MQKTIRVIEARPGSQAAQGAGTGQHQLWEERTGEPPTVTNNHLCACKYSRVLTLLLNLNLQSGVKHRGQFNSPAMEILSVSSWSTQASWPGLHRPQHMFPSEIPHRTCALPVGKREPLPASNQSSPCSKALRTRRLDCPEILSLRVLLTLGPLRPLVAL